ncbi:MAG: sigma-54 dependent transcriptional regulator [Desulfobacterota bacterium]|nr:sigma-54 dependent transcriptional regulator [Thermodesulfobacteriota bacterium]
MATVLIIDDERMVCDSLSKIVQRMGHEVTCSYTVRDGLDQAASGGFDVVFLDVNLPDGNGLEALPQIQSGSSNPEVIIMTGFGDPDGAELAIRNGAWDYIEKPSSIKEIALPFLRALQYREEKKSKKETLLLQREGIVGSSPALRNALDLLARAAGSEVNVLLTGETGTGKELFALAIHRNSPRGKKNFTVVDCTAIPESLVESILFGYEKGAFTGADRPHEGLIKQAHGGTLFLDEVGELPLSMQKAFLRVLQEHRFRPLRGKQEQESDFRLVAATNRNLAKMVEAGTFRQDLLYRLQSFVIELPPLRERRDDIQELALFYLAKLSRQYGTGIKGFSPEFLDALWSYPWPGNVRELFQTLERAFAAARNEPTLFPKHLPRDLLIQLTQEKLGRQMPVPETASEKKISRSPLAEFKAVREKALADIERNYLRELVLQTRGNAEDACRVSGLSRARLYELLKKHRLSMKEGAPIPDKESL